MLNIKAKKLTYIQIIIIIDGKEKLIAKNIKKIEKLEIFELVNSYHIIYFLNIIYYDLL